MIRMPRHQHAALAIEIASEDAVAVRLGAGSVQCQALLIRTETETIRKPLARARDFALVFAVETHAEKARFSVEDDRNQQALLLGKQQHRDVIRRESFTGNDFVERAGLQI